MISRPIQVALSGSGFLLPVHVGALQAIEDAGYAISALSGTSGGAIVAAIYAVQQDAQKLADLVLATDWRPFMDFESWTNGWRLLTRRGIWGCKPKPSKILFGLVIPYSKSKSATNASRSTALPSPRNV